MPGFHEARQAQTTTWLTPPHILKALGDFDWEGRVWLNPPYGAEAWVWTDRLASHGQGTALLFARTDTAGFHRTVWEKASGILFLKGRLRFHRPDGSLASANAGAPSCLVAYGQQDLELKCSGLSGYCVDLEPR